jgi:hypothetical protein
MVADSSGAEGAGCAGVVVGGEPAWAAAVAARGVAGVSAPRAVVGADAESARPAPFADAGWRPACSAARSVTMAAPDKTTPLAAITQINLLFGIAHHSKTYGCTRTVRAVTPGQSQVRCSGGLPIGTPYDMSSALFGAQGVGDCR